MTICLSLRLIYIHRKRYGNCKRLDLIVALMDIIAMRGNKTLSSLNFLINIVTAMAFPIIFSIIYLILLQSLTEFEEKKECIEAK